jgi:hypothetical protein
MIKSRRMSFGGHVARMWRRNACRIFVGKPLGKQDVGGWIIFKWILER